jgi:Tfp pilus assembly protein PilF
MGKKQLVVIISCLVFILLHLIAIAYKSPYLWGVDSIAYLPPALEILFFSFLIISFVPKIQDYCISILESKTINKIPIYIYLLLYGVIVYIFRQESHILGDGYLRIRSTEDLQFFTVGEPFDTFIHTISYALLRRIGVSAESIFQWISILSGVISLWGISYYTKKISVGKNRVFIPVIMLFCTGSAVLFFGYAENYSIIACLLIFYHLSSVNLLKDNSFSIMPAIFLGVAIITHPLTSIFIPSLFLLYFYYYRHEIRNKQKTIKLLLPGIIYILLSLVLPIIILIILMRLFGVSELKILSVILEEQRLLTIFPKPGKYSLLSFPHFLDIINLILLTCPIIIFIPFLISKNLNEGNKKTNYFLITSFIFSFLFCFLFRSDLGYSRDWDLFSFISIPIAFLFFFTTGFIKKENKRIIFPVIIISFLHTFSFVYLNSSIEFSGQRSAKLAETEYWSRHSRAELYSELSSLAYSSENPEEALKYLVSAYNIEPSERIEYNLATVYKSQKKYDEAEKYFLKTYNSNFKKDIILGELGEMKFNTGKYPEAIKYYKLLIDLEPKSINALYNIALANMNMELRDSTIVYFNKILEIEPNHKNSLNYLGVIYFSQTKETDKALDIYRKLILLEPSNANYLFNTALCFLDKKQTDSAGFYCSLAEKKGMDKKSINALKRKIGI